MLLSHKVHFPKWLKNFPNCGLLENINGCPTRHIFKKTISQFSYLITCTCVEVVLICIKVATCDVHRYQFHNYFSLKLHFFLSPLICFLNWTNHGSTMRNIIAYGHPCVNKAFRGIFFSSLRANFATIFP